jgi:predicted kinase
MPTLFIYRGIPASGKTTAAMKHVHDNPGTVRINRDDLRFSMYGKFWDVDEHAVTHMQEALINQAMRKRYDIVSDNTNLRAANVKQQMALAEKWGYNVEFRDFPVTLSDAITRDRGRDKAVGEKVIRQFYDRFMQRGKFPPHPTAPEPPQFGLYVPDLSLNLPEAIIVDIDGTLAHMNGRGPYEDHLVHTDIVDEVVRDHVTGWLVLHPEGKVIIMSGRDEARSRVPTLRWLRKHEIPFHLLLMRTAGDTRNDAIVKAELFERYVEPDYNIKYVLDDRNKVVEMWRAKGIKCLQVADGDF